MIRKIKDHFPQANIVAVDYDPGASRINQENRIKLMLANAHLSQRLKDLAGQEGSVPLDTLEAQAGSEERELKVSTA